MIELLRHSCTSDPTYFDGSEFTNAQLSEIPEMTVVLNLENALIGDEGIDNLPELKNLRCIDLDNTQITDKSLSTIKRFPNLQELWLEDTNVTNNGFLELKYLKQLKYVSILYTQVTEGAMKKLENAIPGIIISGEPDA